MLTIVMEKNKKKKCSCLLKARLGEELKESISWVRRRSLLAFTLFFLSLVIEYLFHVCVLVKTRWKLEVVVSAHLYKFFLLFSSSSSVCTNAK